MSTVEFPEWVATLPTNLDESDFHKTWSTHVDDRMSPFEKAIYGGYCADEPGWVFVAGYQGAIAHTFADEQFAGWSAFAVSEDRSKADPKPGLSGNRTGDHIELSGYKTWVATSRHVKTLIVSFQCDDRTLFARVNADTPGVTLSHRDQPSMLPDLSQGIAAFDRLVVTNHTMVSSAHVSQFAAIEGFYVLVALLACVRRFHDQAGVDVEQIEEMIALATQLQSRLDDSEVVNSFKLQSRDILRVISEHELGQMPKWQRDGKLLAAYARPKNT